MVKIITMPNKYLVQTFFVPGANGGWIKTGENDMIKLDYAKKPTPGFNRLDLPEALGRLLHDEQLLGLQKARQELEECTKGLRQAEGYQ